MSTSKISDSIHHGRSTYLFVAALVMMLSAIFSSAALPLSLMACALTTAVVMSWPQDIPMSRGVILVFGATCGVLVLSAANFGIQIGAPQWLDICETAIRNHR